MWLHDWLIYNANYDYTYTYHDPIGVLLEGTGVCSSYAHAYQMLLDEFNIENLYLSAGEMDHAWNLVKIDGQWFHVDVTWDDPGAGGEEYHKYFGLTDKMMGEDHTWQKSGYPKCTSMINYFSIRMGGYVYETKEEMMEILDREAAAKNMEVSLCYIGSEEDFPAKELYEEWYLANSDKYGLKKLWFGYSQYTLNPIMRYWDVPEDHIHDYVSEGTPPTCTGAGHGIRRCSCGGYYENDEALGHDLREEITYRATCTENGMRRKVCSRCDYEETETIAATGHDYYYASWESTCTEQGCFMLYCDCGSHSVLSYSDVLGHDFRDGVCTRCGVTGLPGDMDENGTVDVDDVLALLWYVLFPDEYPIAVEADLDGNGTTDVDDVLVLLWHVLFPDEYPLDPEIPDSSKPAEPSVMGTVVAHNVDVYVKPVNISQIVTQLAADTRVEILSRKVINGVTWGQIAEGWINMRYVSLDSETGT